MYNLRSRIAVAIGVFALAAAAAVAVAMTFSVGAGITVVALSPVVAYLLGTLLARSFTRPLEHLAARAASFAAGDLATRAEIAGPREIRLIARSFNRMADDVSLAMERLSDEEERKTQFVSDVSHELRTPLTAIRGAAETLLDGDVEPADQDRFLSTIATEAERLTRLANDLLTLQRIEGATGELPFRSVDLAEAAQRAATMLEPLNEDREVAVSIEGTAPLVLGDIDRMQQVIANLIDNASRMVGEGGHVWVKLYAEDDHAVLTVTDDGPGIPDSDLPRLFDRFYRADISRTRTSGGAGLGLAIVRAIVTSHGGTIEAQNLAEGGAKLTLRLSALPEKL